MLQPKHKLIIENILTDTPVTFCAFGSRVKGTAKLYSDLDLCYMEPIEPSYLYSLEEQFEESDLPFKVDIIDYNQCTPEFRKLIQPDLMLFKAGKSYTPNPDITFPIPGVKRLCFLKNIIESPFIHVGDYTYYDDPESVHNFNRNVLYHFDFIGDKLIIGKFCQIATGVKFIMNGANHDISGLSTYPFRVMGGSWACAPLNPTYKGDTIIGNDVWIGYNAVIMPGIKVGDGAIIGAGSIVTQDVEPYTIVAGNPAKVIRTRFESAVINNLKQNPWWEGDPATFITQGINNYS